MVINKFKKLGDTGTYSTFSFTGGNLDQLEVYNIPLNLGSSFISIMDADKELVFSGYEIIKGTKEANYLFLDDLNLTLDAGEYYVYIRQAMTVSGTNSYQYKGMWEPEVPVVPVDAPASLALIALGLLALVVFRRK